MEISGKIKVINDTKTYGESGFRKRELVITTEGEYPQSIMIEFVQDNVGLLDPFKIGQNVKVSFNLRGREWVNPEGETKYFNSITGWKILSSENSATSEENLATPPPNKAGASDGAKEVTNDDEEEEDDLPF